MILSTWRGFIGQMSASLGVDESSLKSIIDGVIFPLWLVLTGLLVASRFMSRGARPDRPSAPPRRDMERHRPYWIAMALVVVAGVGIMIVSAVFAERVAQRCEIYAQQHRILPNQVIDCPFD